MFYNNHPPVRYYGYSFRTDTAVPPASYKTLQEALALIKQSVGNEREDELFYNYLIPAAPTPEEKDIISGIRDDERKHGIMFRTIYRSLTGQEIEPNPNVPFEPPASYIQGVKKALFGELGAMERYRDIRAGLPDRNYRDMVFEILTDEMEHATKYNYILYLAAVRMKPGHKKH